MNTERLRYPYIAVMKDGQLSYGGNQEWGKSLVLKKYGCGAVAGTDVLLYLSLHKEYCRANEFQGQNENGIFEEAPYMELVNTMKKRYFPLILGFGMTGWQLAAGCNRCFRRNRIPLKASFGVFRKNIWNRLHAMLSHDIPVVLSVGSNVPIPSKKYKLAFYEKREGTYREACKTAAHYVTVTGMDAQWLRISSWGKEYYISRREYMDYVKKHSSFLVSNILYIRKC